MMSAEGKSVDAVYMSGRKRCVRRGRPSEGFKATQCNLTSFVWLTLIFANCVQCIFSIYCRACVVLFSTAMNIRQIPLRMSRPPIAPRRRSDTFYDAPEYFAKLQEIGCFSTDPMPSSAPDDVIDICSNESQWHPLLLRAAAVGLWTTHCSGLTTPLYSRAFSRTRPVQERDLATGIAQTNPSSLKYRLVRHENKARRACERRCVSGEDVCPGNSCGLCVFARLVSREPVRLVSREHGDYLP